MIDIQSLVIQGGDVGCIWIGSIFLKKKSNLEALGFVPNQMGYHKEKQGTQAHGRKNLCQFQISL